MARSAVGGTTGTTAETVRSSGFRSLVAAETVAVLVRAPKTVGRITKVSEPEALTASEGMLQDNEPGPLAAALPVEGAALTKPAEVGKVSLTTILEAAAGP